MAAVLGYPCATGPSEKHSRNLLVPIVEIRTVELPIVRAARVVSLLNEATWLHLSGDWRIVIRPMYTEVKISPLSG
jgi:hypothetical protein